MSSLSDTGVVATEQRQLWVDNVRVLVIAGVIVVHTATGYLVDIAGWYYDDERSTSGIWSTVVTVPVFFLAVFALGPLFLIAGAFASRSIEHRGAAGYARSRLFRLGVPVLVYLAIIQPLTDYLGNLFDESRSFWSYLADTEVSVMWFAAALLVISLGFVAWRALRPASPPSPRPLQLRDVVVAAVTIALTGFAVWIVWPLEDDVFLNLKWPAWPQGAVLFALGVAAARNGWITDMPKRLTRQCGWVAVGGMVALGVLLAAELEPGEDIATRPDWPTFVFALLCGLIAVAWSLWFVGWLQHGWSTHSDMIGKAANASYATYFIHPLVLTIVMLVCKPIPLPPEIKFVLVAMAAIPVCFIVGHSLTRLPGASKVL